MSTKRDSIRVLLFGLLSVAACAGSKTGQSPGDASPPARTGASSAPDAAPECTSSADCIAVSFCCAHCSAAKGPVHFGHRSRAGEITRRTPPDCGGGVVCSVETCGRVVPRCDGGQCGYAIVHEP
jgi:hypothetical protein